MTDDTTQTDGSGGSDATTSDRATAAAASRYVDGIVKVAGERHDIAGDVHLAAADEVTVNTDGQCEAMVGTVTIDGQDAEFDASVSVVEPDAAETTTTLVIDHADSSEFVGCWVLGYHGEADSPDDSVTIWDEVATGYMHPGWTHTIEITGTLEWLNVTPEMTHEHQTADATDTADGGQEDA